MATMELQSALEQALAAPLPVLSKKSDVDAVERPKKRHQVAKACNHCAVSHLSCSEHRPCDRCVKKGLECEERPRKKRPVRHDSSRADRRDDDEDLMDDSPTPSPRPARSRKHKRKNTGIDEEYIPDGEVEAHHEHGPDCGHTHGHKLHLGLHGHTISPTSASPRSAQSESSEEHNGSDLESLVVAALAEGEQEVKSEMNNHNNHHNMFDPMIMQAQASMLQMMPLMMPQAPTMNPAMMGYGFHPSFPMDPFGMMHYQVLPIQWRFQGQALSPLTAPLTSSVRDLVGLVYHRLTLERHIQPSDRVSLTLLVNNQRFSIDEQAHALMPLTMVGLMDPTAILEVTKSN